MKLFTVKFVLATEDSATDQEVRDTLEHAFSGDDFCDALCEGLGMTNHRHKIVDQVEILHEDPDHDSEDSKAVDKAVDNWYDRSAKECEQSLERR